MQWPPPSGETRARLVFTPLGAAAPVSLSAEGPWALFRLLDKAVMSSSGTADRYKVDFNAQGMVASFELQAASVFNPFRPGAFGGIQCLAGL